MGATYSVAVFDDLNVTGENKAIWAEFKLSNDLYHGAYWMTGVQTKTLGGYADWIWADDHWPSYEAPKTGLVVKCYCPRKDEVTLTIETMVWFGRKFHVDFSVPMPNGSTVYETYAKDSVTISLSGQYLHNARFSVHCSPALTEGKEKTCGGGWVSHTIVTAISEIPARRKARNLRYSGIGRRLKKERVSSGKRSRPETPILKRKFDEREKNQNVPFREDRSPSEFGWSSGCKVSGREEETVFCARKLAAILWRIQMPE
ncbi:hypothetical protein U1Q18_042122, partial [Sarracenia purpurea var. burkii]